MRNEIRDRRASKCQPPLILAPNKYSTRSLVVKYSSDGNERIFVINVLGMSGNILWATRDGAVHLYERKWIVRMVSIKSGQEVDWMDVR